VKLSSTGLVFKTTETKNDPNQTIKPIPNQSPKNARWQPDQKSAVRDCLQRKSNSLGFPELAKQEALIADLEREGHDSKDALAILATLRETQTQHVLNVERLLRELQQQPK
jgi:hypothetical protein